MQSAARGGAPEVLSYTFDVAGSTAQGLNSPGCKIGPVNKKIAIAGLSLRIRATLQGYFPEFEIVVARSLPQVFDLLEDGSVVALVIDHSLVDAPRTFFVDLDQAFLGCVIYVAKGQYCVDEIRDLAERGSHSVILQHPLDPDELVERLAAQLSVPVIIPKASDSDAPDGELLEVWEGNAQLLETRLALLDTLSAKDPSLLTPEELEEAWRAAFQLAGTLGSFGLHQGTRPAREAHTLVKTARDGHGLLQAERLKQLVEQLREILRTQGPSPQSDASEGTILLLSDDAEFADNLSVDARFLNWEVNPVRERADLLCQLIQPHSRAVALDLDCRFALEEPELVDDLIGDGIPCLLLSQGPCARSTQPMHVAWMAKPASTYEALMSLLRRETIPAPEFPPAILAVDDDPLILLVISATLSKADMHVTCLENPLEFWDHLARDIPDLILLDVDLPALGGFELCRALRALPQYSALPLMFMSSHFDEDNLRRAFEVGADDYLLKPVSTRDLLARVQNRLERTRQVALHPFPLYRYQDPLSRFQISLLDAMKSGQALALASVSAPAENQARLVRLFRRVLRTQDMVRRCNEEELLIGLPGLTQEAARQRLSSILEWENEHAWMGLSEFPAEGTELNVLVEMAQRRREAALPAIQIEAVWD